MTKVDIADSLEDVVVATAIVRSARPGSSLYELDKSSYDNASDGEDNE